VKLRIGIDFDNTLISYDTLFRDLAAERGWLPKKFPASKDAVKERLIKDDDGSDLRWQRLQAEAYGKNIVRAKPFAGCANWLRETLAAGHEVFLVSHKSEVSHIDPSVHLRDAARAWLKDHGFMANGKPDASKLKQENVHFASTRDEKVAQIARLGLDVFIDDLGPVLDHPAFPVRTLGVHFGAAKTLGGVAAAGSWREIGRKLRPVAAIGPDAARALINVFGRAPIAAAPIAGGNNRLLIVTLEDGKKVLLKLYMLDERDPRDRAGAEYLALTLMNAARCERVPRAYHKDPSGAFTILSLLEGRHMRGRADRAHVLQAASFMKQVADLPRQGMPEAAHSRRCLNDYPRHIERRLVRINEGLRDPRIPAEARRFVREEIAPLKEKLLARFRAEAASLGLDLDAPLAPRERIPSPSDFGFHNAVLSPGGQVQFIDFEYFGLDDPAKLAADFTHHVGQKVSPELRKLFVRKLAAAVPDPEAFRRRYELVTPLVGLEWVLIVLNVLAPEQRDRRRFSDPGTNSDDIVGRRLAVAKRIIRRLS
jgi:hypothetical protein